MNHDMNGLNSQLGSSDLSVGLLYRKIDHFFAVMIFICKCVYIAVAVAVQCILAERDPVSWLLLQLRTRPPPPTFPTSNRKAIRSSILLLSPQNCGLSNLRSLSSLDQLLIGRSEWHCQYLQCQHFQFTYYVQQRGSYGCSRSAA